MSKPNTDVQDTTYVSYTAKDFTYRSDPSESPTNPSQIKAFHHSLPDFNTTPLHSLPEVASTLGIDQLFIKAESSRLGLPAFKILGASWGTYRAICNLLRLEADPGKVSIDVLKEAIRKHEDGVVLYAATDGNHGRAVARMARLLISESDDKEQSNAVIYVPNGMYETTKKLIESEGAKVVTVNGDYDKAVSECWQASHERVGGVMVQDNAFDGYETVPRWIVEGYSTLLREVDEQFDQILKESSTNEKHITHVVTPIGVGSLGHAVVKWAKGNERNSRVRVITAEPETAGCLNISLREGKNTTIETVDTIMSGMCCGTVSPISWELLRDGVDCSVMVSDWEAHKTVLDLEKQGIEAGPCGAGCLAGLRKVMSSRETRHSLGLDKSSVVVVLCTEGKREYPVPDRRS